MKNTEICKKCYECKGECLLNIAGDIDAWKIIAKKCKGTKEEQKMMDDICLGKISEDILLNKYDFSNEEKEILKQANYEFL